MKVDPKSWWGKIAWNENPWIADECSLFRALLWGLFKRFIVNIMLPTAIATSVIMNIGVAIDLHAYPTLDVVDTSVFFQWVMDQYWFPVQIFVGIATGLGTMVLTIVPFALAIAAALLAFYFLAIGLMAAAEKMARKRSGEVSAMGVIGQGIANKWNKLCRPITVINSGIPTWAREGQRVVYRGHIEGVMRDVQIAHAIGRVSFEFCYPTAPNMFMAGWEKDRTWVNSHDGLKDFQPIAQEVK